jgi:hypothetical protein
MPLIETRFDTLTPAEKELLADLVAELTAPHATGQPVIEIRAMPRNGLRHVHVIWDRWEACPPEKRASIIREAFKSVKGEPFEQSIAITLPATVPEAVEIGLLPYEVKPKKWYSLQGEQLKRAREVMISQGASVLHPQFLPLLRFQSEQQAEEAVTRLSAAAPEFDWGVLVTVMSPA